MQRINPLLPSFTSFESLNQERRVRFAGFRSLVGIAKIESLIARPRGVFAGSNIDADLDPLAPSVCRATGYGNR